MTGTVEWGDYRERGVFRSPDAQVMGLTESGDDVMLYTLVGIVHYSRSLDSASLAQHLEDAARMVRGAE